MLGVIARIGGLHAQLLSSAEPTLWQSAFNTDPRYLKPFWLRYFGVTGQELKLLMEGITEALDRRILTREALSAAGRENPPKLGNYAEARRFSRTAVLCSQCRSECLHHATGSLGARLG
jgi:hypothetical protein